MSVQADIGEKIQAIIDSYRQEASYAKHMADSIEADWGARDWALLADRRVITQREADIMSGMSRNRGKRTSRKPQQEDEPSGSVRSKMNPRRYAPEIYIKAGAAPADRVGGTLEEAKREADRRSRHNPVVYGVYYAPNQMKELKLVYESQYGVAKKMSQNPKR